MAAIFDTADLSSPLAYPANQTAVLLLDYQGYTIGLCDGGEKATSTAGKIRDWAVSKNMIVVHSIFDFDGVPPLTAKRGAKLVGLIANIKNDPDASAEHSSLSFENNANEFVSLKTPGFVSGMKANDCQEVFKKNDIRSIIICGLSTSGAVLRTVFPAANDGYIVTVIEDACGDRTSELHSVVMREVLPSVAHVATAGQFIEEWENIK